MYKEWVTNDDKDCSIIPIKLKGYRKKNGYRNKYYFVIIVYIICCFNNKEDYFIIIHFHIHLQAACVLDQKSLEISGRRGSGVTWGFVRLTAKPRYVLLLHRGNTKSHTVTALPICTSHWCLVMSFWLKVCIYSHTRGVKLGLGLGFMQTSQVLPHWLNQSFSFWTLSYTQRHCHVRIEKGACPNCCYNIRSTQFPRISLYALTLRFVLIEITKVVIHIYMHACKLISS